MKRTASISIIIAGLFAAMAEGQQPNPPQPLVVITCVESAAPKPNWFRRIFSRKQTFTIPIVFHEPDYRVLTPDMFRRWRQDEVQRLGLHVPARFCATALLPAPKASASTAAVASAGKP